LLKAVFQMIQMETAKKDHNLNNIETIGITGAPKFSQINSGCLPEMSDLLPSYSKRWSAKSISPPAFDFYKNNLPALSCHDIQFTKTAAEIPCQDLISTMLQVNCSSLFTPASESGSFMHFYLSRTKRDSLMAGPAA
jgi:hypothetical protein